MGFHQIVALVAADRSFIFTVHELIRPVTNSGCLSAGYSWGLGVIGVLMMGFD